MNIFSNIGITELVVILLLALLVVGPERLPELGRKLAKTLRDVRKAYENLTKDLGPELMSIQQATQELRESVQSVKSIPQDAVKSVVDAADLDDTIAELKQVTGDLEGVRKTVAGAGTIVKDPIGSAVDTAKSALQPPQLAEDTAPDKETGVPPESSQPEAEGASAAEATGIEVSGEQDTQLERSPEEGETEGGPEEGAHE